MLPLPVVGIEVTSTSEEGCPDIVTDDSDSLTCVASVVSNLLYPPTITLTRRDDEDDDGTLPETVSGAMLNYPLSSSQSGVFTCTVCIDIPEAEIEDYCNSTTVTISSDGKWSNGTSGGYVYSSLHSTSCDHTYL